MCAVGYTRNIRAGQRYDTIGELNVAIAILTVDADRLVRMVSGEMLFLYKIRRLDLH